MIAIPRLIEAAKAAGLSLAAQGSNLIVETDAEPPPALLDELRRHKRELLALLTEAADWRARHCEALVH